MSVPDCTARALAHLHGGNTSAAYVPPNATTGDINATTTPDETSNKTSRLAWILPLAIGLPLGAWGCRGTGATRANNRRREPCLTCPPACPLCGLFVRTHAGRAPCHSHAGPRWLPKGACALGLVVRCSVPAPQGPPPPTQATAPTSSSASPSSPPPALPCPAPTHPLPHPTRGSPLAVLLLVVLARWAWLLRNFDFAAVAAAADADNGDSGSTPASGTPGSRRR